MAEPMKALSIMQPWAWLIVNGHKDIENRDWRCHRRGHVLIHAGKKVDRDAMQDLHAGRHPVTGEPLRLDLPEVFETGGIVGEATMAGCVERSESPWFVGRFGILMRDARSLPFQPCRGALGFFLPTLDAAVAV
ncbi:ASCH domain-containing protein [Methylobacterium sp. XJLW]|uniref:ASCH domain-containing protein n=1 Tax=Methylobacterium sp. XJLW TaxID=739141 RepID=UPI00197B9416|nr:ASCH domain-containing protein [Methylobacterium sp. XJLW]